MRTNKYLSIRLARILMKLIGYWPAESKREKKFLNGLLVYTLFAVALALWIEATELYLGTGDFYAITYTLCTATPVIIILLKLSFFLRHREEMLGMLKYTEDNFWYVQYDAYGSRILERIDRKGIILLFTFTFFVQGAVFTYMLAPIIENRGRNETERILIFNIWVGIPTNVSPNFEILFFLETIALIHSGLCFCCFDNLLGLLNMHTAGQFKMLQHRLETIFQNIERKDSVEFFDGKREHQVFEEIIECVTIHRKLIWYSERMEYFFMYTTLAQLLVSSVLLCVSGLQIFLGHNMTIVRRMIFVAHAIACFFQLFLVTCTSNDLIDESRAIGDAAYNANWQVLSHDNNKGVRNAVLMIMIRAMRPCSISAGGFFPVSLETFMTVLSTAVSYFTLLRKFLGEQGI
ncbi:odorant receptor 13a-like isoform X1 [Polyergus mexicanus]|uniref:odorant receptor 13a-like isoform X1 n=1 Tax=Polyergus mexicanus TaxID=615972 RepID=UPI0038B472C6